MMAETETTGMSRADSGFEVHRSGLGFSVVRRRGDRGIALILVLLAMLLATALALGLALTASSELLVASAYRDAQSTLYAAEAAIERILPELANEPDWTAVVSGRVRSTLVDGPPGGVRNAVGIQIDLDELLAQVRCGRPRCVPDDLTAVTDRRPWGPNNPMWHLYGYGPLATLASPEVADPPGYIVVLVADDPAETDGHPEEDGGGENNPGAGRLLVRAAAYGRAAARRSVQVTVARAQPGVKILSWREVF